MPALALTDTGGVYGAVRFLQSCQAFGVRPLLGAALEVDGQAIVLLAKSLPGWSNLSRLCSLADPDPPNGEARTTLETAGQHRDWSAFVVGLEHGHAIGLQARRARLG